MIKEHNSIEKAIPSMSAKRSINSKLLWVILESSSWDNSVIIPKPTEMNVVTNIDFKKLILFTNIQNKRKEKTANIPKWTILSKKGINEKKPILFGNKSEGDSIPYNINAIQTTKRIIFKFLFLIFNYK